jgi:hypothetical protein
VLATLSVSAANLRLQQTPGCHLVALPACLQGDFCTACGAPFLRSFTTFEVLPLVECQLEPGISDTEALGLLGEDVLATSPAAAGGGRGVELGPGQCGTAGANVLQLDGDGSGGQGPGLCPTYNGALEDAFAAQVRPMVLLLVLLP